MMNYDCHWDVYVHGHSFSTIDVGALKVGTFASAIAHLPGCFCFGTFFKNIVLKRQHRSPISFLYSIMLSTEVFQALQLIVLAVLGTVD